VAICAPIDVSAQITIIAAATFGVDGLRPIVIMAKTAAQTKKAACGIIEIAPTTDAMLAPENIIRDIVVTLKKSPKAISQAMTSTSKATIATAP
jgi:hypothetical protein